MTFEAIYQVFDARNSEDYRDQVHFKISGSSPREVLKSATSHEDKGIGKKRGFVPGRWLREIRFKNEPIWKRQAKWKKGDWLKNSRAYREAFPG